MAPESQAKVLAPGARVEIRDEEWTVRTTKPARPGGQAVHVAGTSELVRNKEAVFLTDLDEVRELAPEATELVSDDSPNYRRSRLYVEALLRRSPPTDDAIVVGHRGAIREARYQLEPAARALHQLRPRLLLADAVGLGKTIEVGILLSELIRRGRGDRILVVALKSVLRQFQEELWSRFTIPLVRLDSVGIQRVQSRIPSTMNPFYYFDRVIISIDTLKKDAKYRRFLEDCRWDVVVIDECQNVIPKGTGAELSQRARLARLLAGTSDGLILTSATPHDGKPENFARLLQLLEPTIVSDPENFSKAEIDEYIVRRFKKDIAHEVEGEFPERSVEAHRVGASGAEDLVFDTLADAEFKTVSRTRGGKGILFRTLLLKAFLSSPAACRSTVQNRLDHPHLEDATDPDVRHDREVLTDLLTKLDAIRPDDFGKLDQLLALLTAMSIDGPETDQRVVVFSERIDTLEFLERVLTERLGMKSDQVEIFHGSLDDQAQQTLVKSFGTEKSPIRILLASDVASEGINLHYYCHRMIHFDLPWSLITLEQRNGRIDRFGQTKQPTIHYLLTVPGGDDIRGDLRVLDRLIEKEDAAHKNLGDAAWLLDLYDSEAEEEHIARGIETHEDPEAVIPDEPKAVTEGGIDWIHMLSTDHQEAQTIRPLRLYSDDLTYARDALREILSDPERAEFDDHVQGFVLNPPPDLQNRYRFLPDELQDSRSEIQFTTDRERLMQALDQARQEDTWPEWQYFWELHPAAQWIDDRILGEVGRHAALILLLPTGLEPGDRIFVFQGVVSNRRSQPVLVDWFGVRSHRQEIREIRPLREWAERLRLDQDLANPDIRIPDDLQAELEGLRSPAVAKARDYLLERRQDRAESLQERLQSSLRDLKKWRDDRHQVLAKQRELLTADGSSLAPIQRKKLSDESQRADAVYSERVQWVTESLRTVEEPYIRLALVLLSREEVG